MTSGTETPRFAVVGVGAISQIVHIPILAEREDVDLVAVADRDRRKAEAIAARYHVPEVVESDDALGRKDIDAVVICTPNYLHEEMSIAALEAGKHVFVERPLATSSGGAERVLAAARASDRGLVVGLPHRFRPEVAALKSFVDGGELGRPYAVRGSWLTRGVPALRSTWRHHRAQAGGGALVDLGVSAIDLCLWLVDYPRIEKVWCLLRPGDFEVEDAAALLVQAEGMVLSIEVSTLYYAREDRYYARVMGTEGSGSLPPLEVYKQLGGRPLEITPRQPRPRGGENPYTNAYRRLIDQFVRRVVGTAETPLPEEQAVLLRLIEAAYRSAEEAREVAL
jgi:predicted dehydrogenase